MGIAKETLRRFGADRGPKMAAALAYYTAFAIAPLLLIAIAVAGLLFGQDAARGEVARQLHGLVGHESAQAVQEILARAWQPKKSVVATILGVITLLLAATGVFGELQDSLNTIWRVRKKAGRGVLGTLKDRFLSFSMVLGIGFLLLVSLVVSAALQAVSHWLAGGSELGVVMQALEQLASFAVIAVLFGAMFALLPDAKTRWRDALVGGAVTAALFTLGKFLIGAYLGRSTVSTTYGAAGSFVLLLLWVNYSAHILFLGAEFTRTWAEARGTQPLPDRDAERVAAAPGSVAGRRSVPRRRSRRRRGSYASGSRKNGPESPS